MAHRAPYCGHLSIAERRTEDRGKEEGRGEKEERKKIRGKVERGEVRVEGSEGTKEAMEGREIQVN